jgi:diguanylate cyclase (GGDEF)-like protein/PAS domain S-box-containing protein
MKEGESPEGLNILENLYEGVYIVTPDRQIKYWNKGAERISGYSSEEVVGRHCSDNILRHIDESGNELCKGPCPLSRAMEGGETISGQVYLHHKDGYRVAVSVKCFPQRDAVGAIIGGIEVFERKESEADGVVYEEGADPELYVDDVTKMGNDFFARESLRQALTLAQVGGPKCAVMYLDVDDYTAKVAKYGDEMGERILRMVTGTFRAMIRKRDIICRLENDDFVILFQNAGRETLERIAQRIITFIRYSFITAEDELLSVTLSIGIALFHDGDSVDELIERSRRLMIRSRLNGSGVSLESHS